MNKFKFYFILFSLTFVLFSCDKSSSDSPIPIRDFDVQYTADNAIIEDYLKTNYIFEISTNKDVTFKKIDASQPSVWSLFRNSEDTNAMYPQLLKNPVVIDDTTYYIYYLKLSADNATGIAPSRADGVLASYNGTYLSYKTEKVDGQDVTTLNATQFEYSPFPTDFIYLDRVVRGWTEIFPLFKSGIKDVTSTEPNPYTDFGAGVIFIPSGLAYFNVPKGTVPSYSPLVFSFKLYDVKFGDQDGDGILSNDEDLDGNKMFDNDDTDGDGIQNLYDVDDDGDGYFTKNEIHKDTNGNIIFEDTDLDGIPNYLDKDNPRNN